MNRNENGGKRPDGLEILSMDVPVTLGFEPREFALPEAVAGAVRMEQ